MTHIIGCSSMKQYLPKKLVKRRFKVWVRAEAQTGYFCDLEVYTGRSKGAKGSVEHGLREKVVLKLSRNIEGCHHKVFCNNYFTTCNLLDILLEDYTCSMTRQERRGFPEELKEIQLQQEDFVFRQKGGLVATVWKDKCVVTTLSTMTQADTTTTVERKQRDSTVKTIPFPAAVSTYNKHMNGVERGKPAHKLLPR